MREHLLLTYQQILERYGRPSFVLPGNTGMNWYYDDKSADGNTTDRIVIRFIDGIVVTAEYQ
jgi:hypothetical protein